MVGGGWWWRLAGWGVGQPGPIVAINLGTRSGTKLYFRKNRTALFDQTSPTAEREAFGEPMSQISSIGEEQMRPLRLGQAERGTSEAKWIEGPM